MSSISRLLDVIKERFGLLYLLFFFLGIALSKPIQVSTTDEK